MGISGFKASPEITQVISAVVSEMINETKSLLKEEITVTDNLLYDIDPDVGLVLLSGNSAVNAIINLPNILYQYNGKRLVIVSNIQSSLTIQSNNLFAQNNINNVQIGDSFEFLAQTETMNTQSRWVRIK